MSPRVADVENPLLFHKTASMCNADRLKTVDECYNNTNSISSSIMLPRRIWRYKALGIWFFLSLFLSLVFVLLLFLYEIQLPINDALTSQHEAPIFGSSHLGNFLVVTAASASFFNRLENLVGSIQYWEPGQEILVVDIGMTRDQVETAMGWKDVKVMPFPFEQYPIHVQNIFTYAWKPILIDIVAKRQAGSPPPLNPSSSLEPNSILVLDAGVELRQDLRILKQKVLKDGYFIASQSNFVAAKTHPDTFNSLNVSSSNGRMDRPFCSGGIQAYDLSQKPFKQILGRVLPCALNEKCINPVGSGRSNHNYDQSALSIVVYDEGLSCSEDRRFFEGDMAKVTLNERQSNDVVLALRRWKIPRPYRRHIIVTNATTMPSLSSYKLVHREDLIETTQSFRVDVDSPLLQCLQQNNNSRIKCASLIAAARLSRTSINVLVEQYVRWAWVMIQKVCGSRQMILAFIFIFSAGIIGIQNFKLRSAVPKLKSRYAV